eukprot:TRINITY_DN5181_c0_g1_i1.p1 TRINITY_DN5181_c0_g1~~TRINITY_DN5181_c0_g1_i1.p1  ORF type:complete len:209 (-),score=101.67 TRINITY_DN5181_c0_g1_i1:67-693(-)
MAAKFEHLDSDAGLKALDTFLADHSYIDGWVPSSADVEVFAKLTGAPDAKYHHALRWYKHVNSYTAAERSSWATPAGAAATPKKEDDDFDLFGDETEEDKKANEEREAKLKEVKKEVKKAAKSRVVFDVKPLDDETDMADLEKQVRAIEMDGLLWGNAQLVPVAFTVKKLQIVAIIVDDLVSTDVLEETISELEDVVQSVDIVSFNKL